MQTKICHAFCFPLYIFGISLLKSSATYFSDTGNSYTYVFSLSQLQVIAKERDERRRANFRRYMAQFNKHDLLFIDESSKDERTFQVNIF